MKESKYVTIRQQKNGFYNVCNNGKTLIKNVGLFGKEHAWTFATNLAKKENKKVKLVLQ